MRLTIPDKQKKLRKIYLNNFLRAEKNKQKFPALTIVIAQKRAEDAFFFKKILLSEKKLCIIVNEKIKGGFRIYEIY